MRLSILVVSRTATLINRFCKSLDLATDLAAMEVEILCSWNGSNTEAGEINNTSRFDFHIAQVIPYHYSSNMNKLAQRAGGKVLMLANDDLVLDPGCVDAAIEVLNNNSKAGLVGAVLRNEEGRLTHAGINFDSRGSAYHLLDQMISADKSDATSTEPVAAVTGALQWIERNDFQSLKFNENYKVCGEDVELCLDVQQKLNKKVWLCSNAKAIHEAESTRRTQRGQHGNSEDLTLLRSRVRDFVDMASTEQLKLFLQQQQRESHQLRELILTRQRQETGRLEVLENLLMDLREERLQLKQEIARLK
ncbi:glycosyltransferase family 2 protein [Synechococcus sp. GEYO]|uniref:glycosyltransferase family 2 protein n=1 Tax=Synechococcus sp. GEYO TaxID=2575511 RepID=UPI000E0E8409|nr:glycosyltransferase family 2 protein [Synechococcus sp. GEYO]